MKKITLFISAFALSLSMLAQGNLDGKTLLNYERFSSAKKALVNASSEEDKYNLGLAELGLGNIEAAKTIFNNLGKSAYGQAGLARIAFMNNDKATAESLLNAIIDGAKKKDAYKYQIAADAINYTSGGNNQSAIEWYNKAIERNKTPELLVALGDVYLKENKAESNGKAYSAFEEAITLNPKFSLAYSKLGLLSYQGRLPEKALEWYNKAQAADPTNPLPYRDLANIYYFIKKFNLAKENIEKYLSLSDATEDDIYQYANILYLTGDYPNTLTKVDDILKTNANPKPYLYRLKAYSLYETGKYPEALEAINTFFTKETNTKKHIFEDFLYRGKIQAALGTENPDLLKNADADFEKAIAVRDTTKNIRDQYKDIAASFEKSKDYTRVANWYGKLLNVVPEKSSEDYYNYGKWLVYAKEYDNAIKTFTEMYDKFELDRIYSEYWRGLAASQLDPEYKNGKAVSYFKNWLDLPTPEGKTKASEYFERAYIYLTYYYYNSNDKANAVKYATLLQQTKPENDFAKQILDYYKSAK